MGMTNAMSADNYCFTTTKNLAITDSTDSWVDRLKFISSAVIPNVLPFSDTQPRNVGNGNQKLGVSS